MNTPPSTEASSPPVSSRAVKVALIVIMLSASVLAVGAVLMKRENLRSDGGSPVARARADIVHFESLVRQYRRVAGTLPVEGQGLQPLVEAKILSSLPVDPWGNPYAFKRQGERGLVFSLGADGVAGGEGLDADVYHPDVVR